ncbi:melanocyte-stimulating hormone receptor-like [Orbicella faveolata]|uniref:melanocyte-stimulating hormone receptor-like n=1 Tax=Orbicella faveolata TaxID=48498 RepID=UPI0009E5D8D5|nr:melanocyte-stimulating hormone receptor-like [Orbicella faveolata]
MASAILAGNGRQKTVEELLCSAELPDGIHSQLTFIAVLNSFLSITAFLGNALILIALHKESSLHPPSKLLLRCLATTDLCVGLISEPLFVTYCMSIVNEHWNMCRYATATGFTTANIFCGVSVLTLTAISVDRLLALLLGLRYRQVVTLKRTYMIVITFWVVSTVISAMQFWNPLITLWCGIIAISLCLVTSIFSYSKIFLTLRHHQNQVQDHVQQPNETNQVSIARYKKALSSAIWLQLAMVICYLPYGVVTALAPNSGRISSVYYAWRYAFTLVFFNSSLNPIFYCWKIEEVRQAVRDTIRQVVCHCFAT